MIVIGYPGVGKSTLARQMKNYIDLESSTFFANGQRPDDWYVYYCNVAEDLSRQGKVVFVSSHKLVVDELLERDEMTCVIYPDPKLKESWIIKLLNRYEDSKLDKDLKAYERARDHFDEDIDNLRRSLYLKIALQDMNYCLRCEIEKFKRV